MKQRPEEEQKKDCKPEEVCILSEIYDANYINKLFLDELIPP